MGKAPNGLGKFSGKVGGVVFAISNGEQIVRAYQPVVSNPKSVAQRVQRAKGNLVGRISQITPWQILEGLGSNRRARRSRFLKLALRNAVVPSTITDPNSINAKLEPEGFKFSEGALNPKIWIPSMAVDNLSISVVLNKMRGVDDSVWAKSGALLVVVMMSADGQYEQIFYRFISSSEFTEGNLTVVFDHVNEGAYIANAYLAPFESSDPSQLATITSQLERDENAFAATLSSNPSAIPLVWGNSMYYLTSEYTPA